MNQKSTHHDSEHTSNPTRHIILCYNYNTVFVHPSHAYLLALYQRRAMSPENGTPFLYVGDLRRLGKIFFASAMCISIFSHGSWSFHTSACLTGASFAPDYLRVAARQTFWIDKKVTLEMQVFEKKKKHFNWIWRSEICINSSGDNDNNHYLRNKLYFCNTYW